MLKTLLIGSLLAPAPLASQGVAVAPHAVHIDNRTRSGAIDLYNPANDPVEVEITPVFGFPMTDTAGTIKVQYLDDDAGYPSSADWIRAFPRRVTVPPRTRQTIRLLAQPPADLPAGEYWVRLAVSSEAGGVPVAGVADTTVKVALALRVRTIIAVSYRNGAVTTGAQMDSLRAWVVGDSLAVRVNLQRQGNAAFLGSLTTTLLDAEGVVVRNDLIQVAVYYDLSPRRMLSLAGLAPGTYTVVSRLTTERSDLSSAVVLQAPPVADSLTVDLP